MGISLGVCGLGLGRGILPPLGVSPLTAADGTQGTAYAGQTFTAAGGNGSYTWSATGLPAGLSLSSGGVLSGTPTTSGAYTAALTATDSAGRQGSSPVSIMVLPSIAFSNTLGTQDDTVTVKFAGTTYTAPRPVLVSYSFAATYFVSTTGSDSNNGTAIGTPFRTITKALSVATAGNIIQVAAGTYTETLSFPASGTSGNPIVLTCAANQTGQVILKIPQATAEANAPNGTNNVLINRQNWITLNGLVFEGYLGRPWAVSQLGTSGACNVTIRGDVNLGTNIVVQNCVGYNALHAGFKPWDSGTNISTGCISRANVWLGPGTAGTDHGNYVPPDSCTVDGNICIGWKGYGVHAYISPHSGSYTKNISIGCLSGGILNDANGGTWTNNVSYQCGNGILYYDSLCTGNAVNHNIFANNTTADCGVGTTPANNTDANNDYFPGGVAAYINGSNGNTATSDVNRDPLFLSPTTGDMRVAANSSDPDKGAFPNYWPSGISMTPAGPTLNGTNGAAFSQTLTTSGTGWTAPATYSVLYGSLPTGISLSSGGVLSGTPSVSGNFTVAIKAVDSSGTPKTVVNIYTIALSPVVYVSDPFGDGASTDITTRLPTINQGTGWVKQNGTAAFFANGSGVAVRGNAGDFEVCTVDSTHADGRTLVDLALSSGGAGNGSVFRFTDMSNYWRIIGNTGLGALTLEKVVAGVTQGSNVQTGVFASGNTVDVRYSGSSIQVFVQGVHVAAFDTTDSFNSTATKSGLYSSNNSPGPSWDNFKITAYS